jgi:hypothetical protein
VDEALSTPTDADANLVWLQILTDGRQDTCKGHFGNETAQGEAHRNGSDTTIRLQKGSDGSASPIGSEGGGHVAGQGSVDNTEEVSEQDV